MTTKIARALAYFDIISEEDENYKCKLCEQVKSGRKKVKSGSTFEGES